MKKNIYIYFIVPLVGLTVFFGFYWKASKEFEEREQNVVREARKKKEEKLKQEAANRELAVKQALELQDKRRAEKKIKDEKDAREAEARAAAVQARSKASRDADKIEASVKRLQKDIDEEKKEITKIQADKKRFGDDQSFLMEYVKQAETNVKNLRGVLEKIAEADRKWEEAQREAAARAAAAAKKS
jgi:hypothetical protein